MYTWHVLAIYLVLGWAGEKSVNGDPVASAIPLVVHRRPVWFSGPVSTSLVFQRATDNAHGESRAFPSPIYYAPPVTTPSMELSSSTTSTRAPPKEVPRKYDIFKFFDKLKRVNEKYANPRPSAGTQKQLNGDALEASPTTADDEGGAEGEREDRTESGNNDSMAEAINEGRKKFHSHGLIKFKTKGKKKISKILYAVIVGLITAKSIIIPLFFKAVVVLSKFSFFVSTLSFIISSILGIKVLLLSNNNNRRSNDNTKVEVVHVPLQQKYPTTYSSSGWIDRDSENKFIPITGNEGERIIYERPYAEQQKGLEKDSYLPL